MVPEVPRSGSVRSARGGISPSCASVRRRTRPGAARTLGVPPHERRPRMPLPPGPGAPDGDGTEAVAARLTGRAVTGVRPVSGSLTEAVLDDGRVVVVKRTEDARAARAEAAGLRWLAGAEAVRVPEVHGHDARWLVVD